MKNPRFIHLSFILIVFSIITSCGYQPMLGENNEKFNIKVLNVDGDQRIGQILRNNIAHIQKKSDGLVFNVFAEKNKGITNKSSTGKILEYSLNISFDLTAYENPGRKVILEKKFSQSRNYKASDLYSNTLNTERKITEEMIESLANEIITNIGLIYSKQ